MPSPEPAALPMTPSTLVAALEDCYNSPVQLTLGRLRMLLEEFAKAIAQRRGADLSVGDARAILEALDLNTLPVAVVATLSDAVMAVGAEGDVLAAFSLKDLEELLSRVQK